MQTDTMGTRAPLPDAANGMAGGLVSETTPQPAASDGRLAADVGDPPDASSALRATSASAQSRSVLLTCPSTTLASRGRRPAFVTSDSGSSRAGTIPDRPGRATVVASGWTGRWEGAETE